MHIFITTGGIFVGFFMSIALYINAFCADFKRCSKHAEWNGSEQDVKDIVKYYEFIARWIAFYFFS